MDDKPKGNQIVKANVNPSDEVRQSNSLVRAVYSLPAQERRILTLVLSKINRRDESIPSIIFDAREMVRVLGMNYDDGIKYLRTISRKSTKRGLSMDLPGGGWYEGNWYVCLYDPKTCTMTFDIPESLKPFLLGLVNQWTAIPADIGLQMTGKYTVRIYENIMSWKGKAKGNDVWVATLKVNDMRKMFMLGDKYQRGAEFTRNIIRPAIDEINTICDDLKITYKTVVVGGSRKIDHYQFTVRQTIDGTRPVTPPTEDEEEEETLTPEQKERLGEILKEVGKQKELPGIEHPNPAQRRAWILSEAMKRLKAEIRKGGKKGGRK